MHSHPKDVHALLTEINKNSKNAVGAAAYKNTGSALTKIKKITPSDSPSRGEKMYGVWCTVLSKKRKSRPLGRLKKKHVIIVHVGSSNLKTNRKQNKRRGIA